MTFAASDLGDIERLARAIGLVDEGGGFNNDWLSNPGDYLASVISSDTQREALLGVVDDLLGGGPAETDPSGRIWLPLFESTDPPVVFFAVVDESASDQVRLGLGVKLTSHNPNSTTQLHLPLFKAGRGNNAVADPILLGAPGGVITFLSEITVDTAPPVPGQAHLRGVGLALEVPTDGSVPDFGLTLGGLQLPGATGPRDIALSLAHIDQLDDIVLDLVLGLLEAQARQAGGAVQAFARLIGLSAGTSIPQLPLDRLATQGLAAISEWAASLFRTAAARDAWLGELAALLQNGAAVSAGRVVLPFGAGRVTIGVDVADGSGGFPVITPVIGIEAGAGQAIGRIAASLFRLDLGSGAATALPALNADLTFGKSATGGSALLTGDPAVDAIRFGLTLDQNRRPAATLALLNVRIGTHPAYPLLDLSSPGAVIESAGQVIGDVVDQVLGALGPLEATLRVALGLSVPPGIPGLSPTSLTAFLSDPLAAVRGYWRELILNHAAGVPQVLTPVRDLIADQATIATPVSGTGTPQDPWTIALVGPLVLTAVKPPSSNRLEIGLAAAYFNDQIGERCTRLDADIGVALVSIDLDGGSATFLSSITAGIRGRPRGARRAAIEFPPMRLSADSVGLVGRWTPADGLTLRFAAPNPTVAVNEIELALDIPDLGSGFAGLSDRQWDAIEFLAGQLAQLTPESWVRDLLDAFGWIPASPLLATADRPRLPLAGLVSAPQATILAWANDVLLRQASRVERLLEPLARVLTGTAATGGALSGIGTPRDPYRIALSSIAGTPELSLWIEPNGPPLAFATLVPERLRGWLPGMPGLSPSELVDALVREARAAPDVADIASGRFDLGIGLSDLTVRWTNTDGRILAPSDDPPGVAVELIDDVAFESLRTAVDAASLLAAPAVTTLRIAVAASLAEAPWASPPAARIIDLTQPALAPNAFVPPNAATGEWFVVLGTRPACRLASGDPDGIAGQAARLERILQPFRALGGGIALVAEGGAGHAARRVAESVAEVSALVTIGTPLGPVAFSVLAAEPAASTLRLLNSLLPADDPADPFDPDLARGRDLVRGLTKLADTPSLADELAPPATLPPAPRAGLEVHAVFGNVTPPAISRALTAIFAAALSQKAVKRFALPAFQTISGVGAGLRLPIALGTTGITVTGHAALELFGADLSGPSIRGTRPLNVHLEVRRAGGWLVGGPGAMGNQDLRWLEFNMTMPLGSAGEAQAEIVLHEPRVFSIRRDRWVVRHAGSTTSADEVVTPALPEAGVLLSGVMRELSLDADAGIATFLDLLEAAGVFSLTAAGGQGGFVASALDSILNQPAEHFRALATGAQSRAELQTILNTVIAPLPGVSVDLAQRRAEVTLSGTPGTVGLAPWSLSAFVSTDGAFGGDLRLGEPGACLKVALNPLTASVEWPRVGQPQPDTIPVWPNADPSRLIAALPSVIVANAIRLGFDYLRELDDGARPLVEAVLDTVGLLSGVAGDLERRARVPIALLTEPAAWMKSAHALGDASGVLAPIRVAAFFDALKPLLQIPGGPGEMQLAPGVLVTATGTGGTLRLGLQLDSAALTSPPGISPRLAFGGMFALDIGANGSLAPNLDVFAGLPGAANGRQAVHLTVGPAVRLFIRPQTGSDIGLYPDPPGLGSVAGAALQVLPFVLDEVAKLTSPPAAAQAARVVRAIGDALDLRTGATPKFDGARLNAWAENPAQRFADRLPALAQTALAELAAAIGPTSPAPLSVSAPAGRLLLQAGPVEVEIATAPFSATVWVDASGVPFAQKVVATLAFDASGMQTFTGNVGPAAIAVNGAALRPLVSFAAGASAPGGARIEVGSALDAAGTDAVFARWALPGGFALVSRSSAGETTDPADVALAMTRVALDLVSRFAMQTPAVQALLEKTVPHTTAPNVKVKGLLPGVFLDAANPASLDPTLFDPTLLAGRFMRLLKNVAEAGPNFDVGGGISIGMRLDAPIVKLTLGVNGRVDIATGETRVSLEADSRWIKNHPPPGLAIGFVDITGPSFAPSLSVNGIGLRVGKSSGPLLDSFIKLGSVATHLFADISVSKFSGGVQIQLSDLAVGAGSAGGGGNAVAQGMLGDTGTGSNALAPAFSPGLAVQKHDTGPVLVSLSAGEGDGPWWLSIQKGFGPLYVEQVGFGVTVRQDQLEKIAVLFDGRVSIAGLVAAVDDLQITFAVTSGASLFDASNWKVDLAGLAVSADIGGVTLAGGLRKFGTEPNIEYVGMLMARVATYGLSIYGGYGTGVTDGTRFTAFFAFGAVTGPIGGPPAFFVTGIGGGFGINRDLIFPSSLSTFGDFVMIQALDASASAPSDPMQALVAVRDTFPMRRDRFWFAAGLGFTSFALVDGVAVVAVSFGGGFELTILGLGRMALPRPQVALVSIEIGLIARFSTRDGVMWVQAELTENSWLLHELVRLTGGFAYVMWFGGPHAGEFVLTLGGFHPDFHRDGYPQVPRLGFRWQASSFISIKGESYFALTSEALMAGGALEASASLGPAWANVSFGANVIIYFDPFRYEAEVHARIAAGVTIDLWLGEITISVSISAKIEVTGPEFHGIARFDVGPVGLKVEFGGSDRAPFEPISWDAFVTKYLEASSPGVARVLTSSTGKGSIPPGVGSNGTEKGTADGTPQKPFEVFSEFELTLTTIAPATSLVAGGAPVNRPASRALGIAPVGDATMSSAIALNLYPAASDGVAAADRIGRLRLASTSTGSFPLGAWGPVQSREDKKVPKGEIVEALNGALLVSEASLQDRLPKEVAYNQVEAGPRKPLPFVTEKNDRARVLLGAKQLADLLPTNIDASGIYRTVRPWMAEAGNSNVALASLRGDRAAPPRLGALGERMAPQTPGASVALANPDPPKVFDHGVRAPVAIAVLTPMARRETKVRRTTVTSELPRVAPPTFDAANSILESGLPARLLRVAPRAAVAGRSLIATQKVPLTRPARIPPAAVDGYGADRAALARLRTLSNAIAGKRSASADASISAGEVAVLAMPNAQRDAGLGARPALTFKGHARVVMFGAGGDVLADITGESGKPPIPQGTERVAVWAAPADPSGALSGLAGWHDGQSLAYVGWSTCLCSGGSVQAENAVLKRGRESFKAGWIGARSFVEGSRLVTTRFAMRATTVVLLIDETASGDPAADFSLSLDGASVARDKSGAEIAPVLLSQGARRVLVYAVEPEKSDAVTVRVLRDGTVTLAGVMASEADAALVAARLTSEAPDALLDAALANPGEDVAVTFVEARRERPTRGGNG